MHKITLLFILLTGSFGATAVYSAESDLLAESREIVQQFAGELRGELLSSLKQGGPLNAIAVCSQKAPAIADKISQGRNLKITRTSLKFRNPENAPDRWEQGTLESFEARRANGEDPGKMEHSEILTDDGKQAFRYMKAIPVVEPCLNCHGKQLPDELNAKLKELYPEDQSTGFSLGEIIGAFSIRIAR